MNILTIILKEFKQNMRNYKANSMMVLFPIVLITILGAAFSGQFNNTITINDMKVLYTVDAKENKQLTNSLDSFFGSLTEELGIQFEETIDIEASKASIEDYNYSAYLHIKENPLQFDLYKNDRQGFNATLLESALNSYIKTYGAMSTIAVNTPTALGMEKLQEHNEYIKARSMDRKRQPGSMDYYAITMLTMIMLYAALTGFWGVRSEIEEKTAARTLCAPVRNYEFLTGKVAGGIIVTITQGLVVILFSSLVLKAYWGENILMVALLLLTYSIMTISLGVALAYLFRNGEAAMGILNTAIPILVFLGGGYVPMSVMNNTISSIAVISPVKWINSALFKLIYEGDLSDVFVSIGINLSLAALFIITAALLSRKGNRAYA